MIVLCKHELYDFAFFEILSRNSKNYRDHSKKDTKDPSYLTQHIFDRKRLPFMFQNLITKKEKHSCK